MNEAQININYARMIGDREIQLEAFRAILQQKEERIKELEEQLNLLSEDEGLNTEND